MDDGHQGPESGGEDLVGGGHNQNTSVTQDSRHELEQLVDT